MPPKPAPPGVLRKAEDAFIGLLQSERPPSPDDPDSYPRFFRAFYQAQNDDGKQDFTRLLVSGSRVLQFQFREAAAAFRMIEEDSVPVLVRFGDSDQWISQLRALGPKRELMRRLQRYTVGVPRKLVPKLLGNGLLEELPPAGSGLYVQTMSSLYSETFGLNLDLEALNPGELII